MKDKVLLTGATGLLGSFILKWLIQNNIEVRALIRKTSDKGLIKDVYDKVDWFECDMLDYLKLEKAFEGCNRVIHAAAVVSFASSDRNTMVDINVSGTKNLVDLSLEKQIKHFVHISSVAAIGRPKLEMLPDEATPWEQSTSTSEYAKSKYLSELEVWRGIAEGLSAVILNPSFVLGPGDWNKSSTQLFRYVWKENMFYTTGKLNYIDVRDVVKAVEKVYTQEISNERFILNSEAISFKMLFDKIAERWNKRKPGIKVNSLILNIAWRIEAVRSFFTGSTPMATRDSSESAKKQHVFNSEKSKEVLNMEYNKIDKILDWICPILKNKYN